MGYAKEKNEVNEKIKRIKWIAFCGGLFLLVVVFVFSFFFPPNTWQYRFKKPKVGVRGEGELRMHFVDVGQGDCTILELPDGKIAIIDGGDGSTTANRAVLRYLYALDVETIDYMILTHADQDHVGGLTEVLENFDVARVFLPLAAESDTAYDRFFAAVLEAGAAYTTACPPDPQRSETQLTVADGEYPYTLSFIYPQAITVDGEMQAATENNALSSVLWLDYQGVSALFTGDAPTTTENTLMLDDGTGLLSRYGVDLKSTEILKVAHHGSADSTSKAFVEYMNAETAIVSCGAENAYGHPSAEVIETLTGAGVDVYRTDTQGSVIVTVTAQGEYGVFSPAE